MATIAALEVQVGADISGALGGLTKVNRAISGATGFLSGAAATALGFGTAMAAGAAASALGSSDLLGVGLASELENVQAQLTAFTGSGSEAAAILGQIRAEADKTPFAFKEMADATATLLPSAKQAGVGLMDLVKQAEVLAALHPDQGLGGAAFALREALGGDFQSVIERFDLPRQRLNELRAQGVPALQAISTALREMGVDERLVSNLSQTFSGRVSTFQDTLAGIRVEVGKPILAALGGELDRFSGLLNANLPLLQALATTLGTWVANAITTAGQALATFLVMVQNISASSGLGLLQSGFIALEIIIGEVFGPQAQGLFHGFLAALQGIPAVVTTAVALFQQWAPVIAGVAAGFVAFQVISGVIGLVTGLAAAVGALTAALTTGGTILGLIVGILGGPVTLIILAVAAAIGLLTAAWIGNWGDIQGKVQAVWGVMQPIFASIGAWIAKLIGWLGGPLATLQALLNPGGAIGGAIGGAVTRGLPSPAQVGAAVGGRGPVDNSVTVSMTGPVNASDPADVQRFLDQIAAAAAAGQASAALAAPNTLVGAA
jgi:hypothetical protein